ncbi:hypothetical protein ScPMuIL_009100 [Solemya velum]
MESNVVALRTNGIIIFLVIVLLYGYLEPVCGFIHNTEVSAYNNYPSRQENVESVYLSRPQITQNLHRRRRRINYKSWNDQTNRNNIEHGIYSRKMQSFLSKLEGKKLLNSILKPVKPEFNMVQNWDFATPITSIQTDWPMAYKTDPFHYAKNVNTHLVSKSRHHHKFPQSSSFDNRRNKLSETMFPHSSKSSIPGLSVKHKAAEWGEPVYAGANDNFKSSQTGNDESDSFGSFDLMSDDNIPLPVSKSFGFNDAVYTPDELSQFDRGDFNLNSEWILWGSFVTDTSGCTDIETKTCKTDHDCSCNGFYECAKGKCQLISSDNTDSIDSWGSVTGSGMPGGWGEGPMEFSFDKKNS